MTSIRERSKRRIISILRKLEVYTRTDNVYLTKNTTLLFLIWSIGVLNGFVLYILISRILPKDVYGQYKYFLSLFSLFSVTTFTGVEAAVTRAVANGNDGAVKAGFRRKLLGGMVGSVITLCIAGYYALNGRTDLAIALSLMAVFAPWIYAANVYGSTYTGKKLFKNYTRTNIITSLLAFIGMVFAFIFIRDPVWLFAAFLFTSLTTVIAYAFALRTVTNNRVGDDTLSFATHLTKLDILGTIANNIDSILVFHFLGAASLAVYSFAIIPVEQMKGLLKSFQGIALPKFATSSLRSMQSTIGRKVALFMIMITLLMGIYILLAPPFFRIFFPAYVSAVPLSQVYSLSLIFAMPASLFMTLFIAKGLKKETTQFNVANYTIQILLLVIGAWKFGLWGVIVARMVSRTLMFFTAHTILHRAKTPLDQATDI